MQMFSQYVGKSMLPLGKLFAEALSIAGTSGEVLAGEEARSSGSTSTACAESTVLGARNADLNEENQE